MCADKDNHEVLAELHPPRGATSGKSRPTEATLATLVDTLLRDPNARSLGSHEGAETVAVEADNGRNIVVRIDSNRAAIVAELEDTRRWDDEHGRWEEDEHANDRLSNQAWEITRRLQEVSGWHVETDDWDDFDPIGACAGCGVELFAWQEDACAVCGHAIEHEDDEYEPDSTSIATLAAPDSSDASRWYRPRGDRTIAELTTLLLSLRGATLGPKTDEVAVVVIAVGKGENALRVTVRFHTIEVDELDGADEPSAKVFAAGHAVVTALQQATGWYVRTLLYEDCEPCGACPKCHVEVFRWQKSCAACATPIPAEWKTESELMAELVVDALLSKALIELAGERDAVVRLVASDLRIGSRVSSILATLTDDDDVAEIFATDDELGEILDAARTTTAEILASR